MVDTLFSSFAYPGFFPPTKAFNTEWFDGASVNTLDVLTAINYCLSQPGVESESDITIDVILTSSADLSKANGKDLRPLGMLLRFLEVNMWYGSMNGLERAKFSHPSVNYRHVISPTVALPATYYPLSLNATDVKTIIDQGVADGTNAIKNKRATIDDYLEYYKLKKFSPTKVNGETFEGFLDKKIKAEKPEFLQA